MIFNSMLFFVFFVVITTIYFCIPHRLRWMLLLAGSYYFYACWRVEYSLLMLLSTVIAYVCAIETEKRDSRAWRKAMLLCSLISNLGILFLFKYFDFLSSSVQAVFAHYSIPIQMPLLHALLPVGISFYTFQTLSYTIDVYQGKITAERHFGRFALYVSFFPQLVAGPIERATHLLPQFREEKRFDFDRLCDGGKLMVWGLFKKVIIADHLGMYVDSVYNNVGHHSGLSYILATYFFAFQIYCDFSGYSDIAIGSARVMGFSLMKNFNLPYFATSIVDFWRRWHISLSTWLRDYLYIPLGGNRHGTKRTYANLLITMVLGGIWHGANWTFVIWGVLQGGLLCLSKLFTPWKEFFKSRVQISQTLIKGMQIVITFHLVCLSWVFFRANTVSDAFYILGNLFKDWPRVFMQYESMICGCFGILVLLFVQTLQLKGDVSVSLMRKPIYLRWAVYGFVLVSIVLFGADSGGQFIYFQF